MPVLVPGYEYFSAGVRGYKRRGLRILVPWYESISAGSSKVSISAGV